ncbi:hypothetical protein [Gulbenkiania mobilis]|uniref:hypothetical protein n=1 Tax=Gulbenkiania mobilis TaxID=397457 RepID=UPI00128EE406|nr:hypothetical protein [Gulbenkiania mobilis]
MKPVPTLMLLVLAGSQPAHGQPLLREASAPLPVQPPVHRLPHQSPIPLQAPLLMVTEPATVDLHPLEAGPAAPSASRAKAAPRTGHGRTDARRRP